MIRRTACIAAAVAAWLFTGAAPAPADAVKAAGGATEPTVVLDTRSPWRVFFTLRPPVVEFADGPKTLLMAQAWLNRSTAEPPAGWTAATFDDARWPAASAHRSCDTPYLSRLCLRGTFTVTDTAKVVGLRLSVSYHGGAIVYVNGKEIARGHLPAGAGAPAPGVLAEGYPREAFVTDDGKLTPPGDRAMARLPKQSALRRRTLADVAVPAELLRRGANVLAVEIVRAPYHPVVDKLKGQGLGERELRAQGTPYNLSWNTCALADVRLTAAGSEGLIASAAPGPGLQAWSGDLLAWDSEADFGCPAEPLRPVSIVAARNGSFSGKLLVAAPGAIEGLKVTASDLAAQGGAKIAASQVRLRYAVPWTDIQRWGMAPAAYDILLESPPEAFPAGKSGRAVVPVWVTVKVPRQAPAGTYRGTLAVEAAGHDRRTAPVEVTVADWTLPEAQQWRTWVDLIQSPDTLAVEYNVPLWSEKHWAMIARSMTLLGEIGSRTVYVPLICHTNFGNDQSMVRWIRKDGGRWDHDFSVMERYLDVAQRHMGRPKIVCLNAWDIYLNQPKQEPKKGNEYDQWAARYALRGKGPAVTVLEPAGGKTETFYLPRFEAPESKDLWRPVFDEVRRSMKRRALDDATMLGMFWELPPSKAETAFFNEMAPGAPWVNVSHIARAKDLYGIARVGYWMKGFALDYSPDPAKERKYGWKQADLLAEYHRFAYWNTATPTTVRYDAELNITGGQRGIGRIGGDYWLAVRDKHGRRVGTVADRYPQSKWHNWGVGSWLLAPGPDGPVATARYENVREGLQECEARIAIETALTDDALRAKLGDELARRCQEALDERMRYLWTGVGTLQLSGLVGSYATYVPQRNEIFSQYGNGLAGHAWFLTTGWQERGARLFALAGEVARKIGER